LLFIRSPQKVSVTSRRLPVASLKRSARDHRTRKYLSTDLHWRAANVGLARLDETPGIDGVATSGESRLAKEGADLFCLPSANGVPCAGVALGLDLQAADMRRSNWFSSEGAYLKRKTTKKCIIGASR